MLKKKKRKLILIADRGSSDVSVRLGFLASKIIKKKKIKPLILYEFKQKKESKDIFNLFKLNNSQFIGVKIKELILLIKTLFLTFISIIKILIFGFDWFVKSFEIEKIRLGDLIYDRYIRKGHKFVNPNCLEISFLILLFKSIFKFLLLKKIFKKNNVKYSLIGSNTYISISTILMRVSQFYRIPVIYVSGESYKIIRNKKEIVGDIISKFVQNQLKYSNQKRLKIDAENYFKKRVKGKLTINKYDIKKYFDHDELNWMTSKDNNNFIKKIKIKKLNYSNTILYAPHCFAESNHRCGDLIFRDFYQEAIETLEFAKKQKNILWLFKIHPYSQKRYNELKIVKKLYYKYKSPNILLVPFRCNNEKLFKLVDLVVSTRGHICLEAATFGVRNIINSHIFYDDGKISYRAKNKNEYFKFMSNVNSLKKLDKTIVIEAKKILYFRKKLQVSNPYNLLPARKLIGKNEFYNKLKRNIKKTSLAFNAKNKIYADIVEKI